MNQQERFFREATGRPPPKPPPPVEYSNGWKFAFLCVVAAYILVVVGFTILPFDPICWVLVSLLYAGPVWMGLYQFASFNPNTQNRGRGFIRGALAAWILVPFSVATILLCLALLATLHARMTHR